jgi:O-antigen ligase
VPALAAVALFVVWATSQAGYPVTHWAPGGLIVLVLLCIALTLIRPVPGDMPGTVKVALGALGAYTALSYLSILWAGVRGDAWEGANRTLLYLLVFTLFACWPQRARTATLLLGVWTSALIALAAFTALHIDAASTARLATLVPDGRLAYPSGYPNANSAQWLMAFWPALLLARSARLPWAWRGLLAGGAVLLAEVALLSQSRGSLYATPVMLVLVFALLSDRLRTFALLVPVTLAIAAAAPAVLAVGNQLQAGNVEPHRLHSAVTAMFLAALAVGLVVALGAALETRRAPSEALAKRVRGGLAIAATAVLVLGAIGGLAVAGNPVKRVESAWHSFKGGYGANSGPRLVSGLGSNRYDFYRVALDEFVAHPLLGIGADNFQQQYLQHGRSEETPRYPHSVEIRTLVQSGLLGTLIALVGLGAALLAVARTLRTADPLARAVAAAAVAGFAYWVVGGSFDWFWEFAGLGAPAFALLGLVCALAPRKAQAQRDRSRGLPRPALLAGAPLALLAAASLAAPWLGELQIESAASVWTRSPLSAYARLSDAAGLNPLSDQAYLVAGDIALRYDDLARAGHDFTLALGRSPNDAYATLELGAIASSRGDRTAALNLLGKTVRLSPRDQLARAALRIARQGGRVDVQELNREILQEAQQFA